jgi:wyosine [tRNA(Phe)-imidazoG37] synthetase (radical SAM superfamily)
MHNEEMNFKYNFFVSFGNLIKHQIENLLSIIDLEENGKIVKIDEIQFDFGGTHKGINSPDMESCKTKYDVLSSYKLHEPRLLMIGSFLGSILHFTEFRKNGRHINVDGFRLRNLNYWARYPYPRLLDNFGEICSACSCDCEFCFLKGTAITYAKKNMLSIQEALTREKYYSKEERMGLPVGDAWPGEPFLHPHILDFIKIARRAQPGYHFDITTNGDFLTPDVLDQIARLLPITLIVSVNTADIGKRQMIMKSKCPKTAISAIPYLQEKGIQFVGSIVPALNLPMDDIEKTIRYLDEHQALNIRIILPGFTKYHDEEIKFNTEEKWGEIILCVERLKHELSTPIMVQPALFLNRDISAVIDGIYKNSPAERVGLRQGDRITQIDDTVVITKAEASDLLHIFHDEIEEKKPFRRNIKIERNGELIEKELINPESIKSDFYPYKPAGYGVCDLGFKGLKFGIYLIDSFRLEYLERLKKCIDKYPDIKRVLLFTTPLVKDLLAQAVMITKKLSIFEMDSVELNVTVAEHNFWQGNIIIGDIHVVQDYIDQIMMLKLNDYIPDLIIIPSSFVNEWGFDVLGNSYLEIERHTGIRVELLTTQRIMI